MSSSKKHIVITVLGSLGDLHPMLTLGQALVAQGCKVTIATTPTYQDKVEHAGLDFHAVGPWLDLNDQAMCRDVIDMMRGPERLIRRYILPELAKTTRELEEILPSADCLLNGTLVFAGGMLAEKAKIPWVSITLQPFGFMSPYDPSVLPFLPVRWGEFSTLPFLPAPLKRRILHTFKGVLKAGSYPWFRPLRQLRKQHGVPSAQHPLFEGQYSPHLNLGLFSPAFASPQADWPAHTLATGFPFPGKDTDRSLPDAVTAYLNTGSPPIIATLGSSAVKVADDFYDCCTRVAKQMNQRLLVLTGGNTLHEALDERILVWDYLPYQDIFPYASAIVHSGGIGTTSQAMKAGKPMLIIPYGFDQPDNAARAKRLGVSRTIPLNDFNDSRLSQDLNALLRNPEYQLHATQLGLQLQGENGVATAVEAICRLIEP